MEALQRRRTVLEARFAAALRGGPAVEVCAVRGGEADRRAQECAGVERRRARRARAAGCGSAPRGKAGVVWGQKGVLGMEAL